MTSLAYIIHGTVLKYMVEEYMVEEPNIWLRNVEVVFDWCHLQKFAKNVLDVIINRISIFSSAQFHF